MKLVDRILAAKARDAEADVSAWEREIDELVYALYGLRPEEKGIVRRVSHRGTHQAEKTLLSDFFLTGFAAAFRAASPQ